MYYSTSWANDGVQWSAPAPLNDDPSNPYWTPTASIGPDGHIYLWAPRTSDLAIERLDLGAGGANISDRSAVTGMSGYENPDIRYRPALGLYQMLADRGTGIDYFSSSDGLSFTLGASNAVTHNGSEVAVRTPTSHPDTNAWVYFAATPRQDGQGNSIYWGSGH